MNRTRISSILNIRLAQYRASAASFLLVTAFLLATPVVYAHAKLIRSEPKANGSLDQLPRRVELWFNEELEPGLNQIEVKDERGKRVDRGEVTLSDDGKKAQVELEGLEPGKYTVNWKVLSNDEHTIRGNFAFSVTTPQAAAIPEASLSETPPVQGNRIEAEIAGKANSPVPSNSVGAAGDESSGKSSITWADNLVRWISYLAMFTLFGGFAVNLFVIRPSLIQMGTTGKPDSDSALNASARQTFRSLRASVIILVLASFISLLLQTSAVYDKPVIQSLSPALWGSVIRRTGYGTSWLLQIGATAALFVVIILSCRRLKSEGAGSDSRLWWFGLATGAALLFAPSLTGHAAASAKEFRLATIADWLHLVSAAFWVGGLFHLALTLSPALSRVRKPERISLLHSIISGFTRVAVPTVAVVALSGLYNAWVHIESLGSLVNTAYGRTLLVKLALVLLMLTLGAINNFHFGKRAKNLAREPTPESDEIERGFSRSLALEAGLGVLVLLITAVLVFLTPARIHTASAANASTAETSAVTNNR